MCFFECCAECHIVLYHQPLLHPDPSFVGFSRGVFYNVVFFRVNPKPKLSVEVSRDDSDVFLLQCDSMFLYMFLMCMSAYPEWEKYTLVRSILW